MINGAIADFNKANPTKSCNSKLKIISEIEKNGGKDVEIIVPIKHLSNFWRTLEIPLVNDEINLILNWSDNCVIVSTVNANQRTTFPIADTKLYVPVLTLANEDNKKPLQQSKSGSKRTITWEKYQSKVSIERPNQYLDNIQSVLNCCAVGIVVIIANVFNVKC